jgi:CO/xanthine dehydrogenase FAD-binding subunit
VKDTKVQTIGYERPETLAAAVAILDRQGDSARLLAGGTDLIIALREGRLRPAVVVDAKRIPELRPAITEADGRLSIGADTVMTDIAADTRVRKHFPALAEAAAVVGAVQIRNRATLAGNIANASPAADTAPPLLAYAAEVIACGPAGPRRIPVHEFFVGPGETALARGELITAIELRYPVGPAGSAFGRLTRRRGADLASVSVSASIDGSGRTRFGFGAVGPRPLLATDDSGVLADPATDPATRASLLATLAMATSPVSDVRASREYRMSMLAVLGERVLGTAITRRAEGWR